MAVYTQVSDEDLRAFLAAYDLPPLLAAKGIAEGTANSNYLLITTREPYILTLYEKRTDPEDLPFFIGLMRHLSGRKINCPQPVTGLDGEVLRDLCKRKAAVTSFLPGTSVTTIRPEHCAELGRALAGMHLAVQDFPLRRPNALSLASWRVQTSHLAPLADGIEAGWSQVLLQEMAALEAHWPGELPCGVIHADLFPDNVFFIDERLSGLIDFYYACNDMLAYDLAICLNAWCFENHVSFNVTKARQLLRGYMSVRPLVPAELKALPWLCRGAALNFMLMRLGLWFDTPPYRLRDPRHYWKRLTFHQQVESVSAYGLEDAA